MYEYSHCFGGSLKEKMPFGKITYKTKKHDRLNFEILVLKGQSPLGFCNEK